ncbi:hypothetical protein [Bacillus gobiensis]|uniref:hypothetical protein n=1 Tax=Bacillus gobiensis TaxID=1441095 RepID=UPI003D21161F
MNFPNVEHQKRFWNITEQIPANLKTDRKLLSVSYIMASSEDLENKMAPHIHWIEGFDYKKMFEVERFSVAEKVLAKVAVSLYDNGFDLQFIEVFSKLNQDEKEIAVHAANYRYNTSSMYEPGDGNLYIK